MTRLLRFVMAGLTAVALTMTALATPAARAADASVEEDGGCGDLGLWPASVQGRPAGLHAGSPAGVYVWHESDGWHLFVTHPGHDRATFTGKVVSSGSIFGIGRRTEGPDKVAVTSTHKTLGFRFTNYGHLDGIDFRTRCAERLTISAKMNGTNLTPEQVFIGHDRHHPSAVPFDIVRIDPDPRT